MSKEKYGITDAHYLCDSAIFNTETNEILRLYQVCEMLNQQYAKISDLEAKLAEKGQEVEMLKAKLETAEYWNKKYDDCQQQLAEKDKTIDEINKEFVQAIKDWKTLVAEKDNTITNLIEDSKASKELLKKELEDLKAGHQKAMENALNDFLELRAEFSNEKDKLAEKIANLNGLVRERDKQIKNLKTNKKRVIEHKNKSKTEFAIEKLQRVREEIDLRPVFIKSYTNSESDKILLSDVFDVVDTIIKEIGGENGDV